MDYIIFDLEWNQPYGNDIGFMKRTGILLNGEIIQIGAVKLNSELEIVDTFKIIVKPQFLCTMHKHVQKLTGITEEELALGAPFKNACKLFRDWCGEDSVLLSWGNDDILMWRENLALHGMLKEIKHDWCDAQLIYAYETYGEVKQYSLQHAMEEKGVTADGLEAHDALHDAIFTANVCRKLPLQKWVAEYDKIAELVKGPIFFPDTLAFFIYEDFIEKKTILSIPKIKRVHCPHCQKEIHRLPIERLSGDRHLSIAQCPTHGELAVQWRIGKYMAAKKGPRFYLMKTISESTPEIRQLYYEKAEKNQKKREEYRLRLEQLNEKG